MRLSPSGLLSLSLTSHLLSLSLMSSSHHGHPCNLAVAGRSGLSPTRPSVAAAPPTPPPPSWKPAPSLSPSNVMNHRHLPRARPPWPPMEKPRRPAATAPPLPGRATSRLRLHLLLPYANPPLPAPSDAGEFGHPSPPPATLPRPRSHSAFGAAVHRQRWICHRAPPRLRPSPPPRVAPRPRPTSTPSFTCREAAWIPYTPTALNHACASEFFGRRSHAAAWRRGRTSVRCALVDLAGLADFGQGPCLPAPNLAQDGLPVALLLLGLVLSAQVARKMSQ